MGRRGYLRDARKLFVIEIFGEAMESNLTSNEIRQTIKCIEKNIEIIRQHCDKIMKLSTTKFAPTTMKPYEQWLLEDVLEFIRYDEDWFLLIQERVEMLCKDRDVFKTRQTRTIQDVINELKLWEKIQVKDLHVEDLICYKDGNPYTYRNEIYVGEVTEIIRDGALKIKDEAGTPHNSPFVDTKICWRKSENADEENAELKLEHFIEIIRDLVI